MPHITIEYSAGIEATHDLSALCDAIYETLAAQPAIPDPSSLKIRAIPCAFWRLGTDLQTFAHVTFLLLPGRSDETKSALAAAVLDTLNAHLPTIASLSIETLDLGPAYAKRLL